MGENKKQPNILKRLLFSYRHIPNKKPYIEFLTALLSIPVLLTVILLNLNTLRGDKQQTPPPAEKIIITIPAGSGNEPTNAPTSSQCTPKIGPIAIVAPEENEEVTDNPVFVEIDYDQSNFCSVVWSYRINGGRWSDFDDRSIALYNPPPGNIKLELRVKSVVSNEGELLTRNFVYKGTNIVPTSPIGSGSAN